MNDYVPGPSPRPHPAHDSAGPRRRRRRWPYLAIAAGLAAGLTAVPLWPRITGDKPAGPANAATVTSFTINGMLALGPGQFVPVDGTSCAGTPAYKDLKVDTVVVVTDAEGGVIGTSRISQLSLDGSGTAGTCDMKFSVPDIPIGKGTYSITVGHRGPTKYDETKLRSGLLQMSVD